MLLTIIILLGGAVVVPSHAFVMPASSSSVLLSPSAVLLLRTTTTTTTKTTTTTTQLHIEIGKMFGGGGGGSSEWKETQLPKDIKDAISKCREAVQKGLGDRISRMDIEMPVGANFGLEDNRASTKKNKRGNNLTSFMDDDDDDDDGQQRPRDEKSDGLTMEKLDKSNRELARLFVEMFQPLGGEHICAVFNDEYLADVARQRWLNDDRSAECNIMAIDRKGKRRGLLLGGKKKGKQKKTMGFASKLAEEMEEDSITSGPFLLPKGTEVAIFVSPGPKELIAIERICNEVGMGTCIILLNARLYLNEKYSTNEARKLFTEEFIPIWSLSAAPQDKAPGCLLHRAYPGPWVLARRPKVGPPKTIAVKDGGEKFTEEECASAYGKIEISELEKGTELLAENLAGWFK